MKECLNNFLNWAHKNGVFIDEKIEFSWSKKSGIFAKVTEDIIRSTELIRIPKHLTIGPDITQEFFPNIIYENPDSLSGNEITLLLISKLAFDQKCSNQKFLPYFSILPKNLNLPYFWKEKEIDLLKNTDAGIFVKRNFNKLLTEWISLIEYLLTTEILDNQDTYLKEELTFFNKYQNELISYNEVSSYLQKEGSFWYNFRNYLWAYCIITSRGFPYILTSADKSRENLKRVILVPVLDLLNHNNDSNVTWKNASEENDITFQVNDQLEKNNELFNNYGNKSNIELLMNYGFVIENNCFDETTISLQINDKEKIEGAMNLGIKFLEGSEEIKDINKLLKGINFKISNEDPLPLSLVNFFAYLMQLRFENSDGITLRMKLDGLIELQKIIMEKLSNFKLKQSNIDIDNNDILKLVKDYKNGQKKLFQTTLESLQQYEKKLIKYYKEDMTSFKTIIKNDKKFMAFLSQHFGIKTYENIVENNLLDDAFVLWILRVSKNKPSSKDEFLKNSTFRKSIDFISHQFEDIENTIEITKDDIEESQNSYKLHFPLIKKKYDIYSKSDYTISDFIIAQTVVDRVCYIRQNNQELFIVQKVKFNLN